MTGPIGSKAENRRRGGGHSRHRTGGIDLHYLCLAVEPGNRALALNAISHAPVIAEAMDASVIAEAGNAEPVDGFTAGAPSGADV